jgi:hypothetical protein
LRGHERVSRGSYDRETTIDGVASVIDGVASVIDGVASVIDTPSVESYREGSARRRA